jgi:tripartite ATP-independent transporter DctP family solute receptor
MLSVFVITQPIAAMAAVRTIRLAHSQSMAHPVHQTLLEFKASVEERSKGTLHIDLYPNAVMGSEFELLDQIMLGTLDACIQMGATVIVNAIDKRNIEELPWLFPDKASARRAWDGALGDYCIREIIEPASGGKVLAFWESGYRHITNNIRPIVEPSDLAGLKLRLPVSEIRLKTFTLLGASPIQIAFGELFTSLQQGVVDGQENPLAIISASKFYEAQRYLSLSGHVYSPAMVLFSGNSWASLTAEQQQILQESAIEGRERCRQIIDKMEADILETLKANGMEINEVNQETFVKAVKPIWDEFRATFGDELIDLALEASR